jgi:hypothetical protein
VKRLLLALAVIALSPAAFAQTVVGRYEVRGTNLDGSRYGGRANVTGVSDTTCTIVWQTGDSTSRGICMRQGNVFVAGYRLGEAIGLAVYRWNEANGSWDGTWTIAGQEGTGTERLIPSR